MRPFLLGGHPLAATCYYARAGSVAAEGSPTGAGAGAWDPQPLPAAAAAAATGAGAGPEGRHSPPAADASAAASAAPQGKETQLSHSCVRARKALAWKEKAPE